MKKQILFLIVFCCIQNGLWSQTPQSQEPIFEIAALKSDLEYLKNKLEDKHPNLYVYSDKLLINKSLSQIENSITQPMTELEFYKLITPISAVIKDGHTIILPSTKTIEYHNKNSLFFPYHLTILNDQLYVDRIESNNQSIPVGAEIISINDIETKDLLQQLIERQVRDGDNLTYPTWIVSQYFRPYYSFIFGHPDTYTIRFKNNEQINTAVVKGETKERIDEYRQRHYPNVNLAKKPNEGLQLAIEKDHNYAMLTIKDFDNAILKNDYKQDFEKVITAYFEQINTSKTENLIIDLRNNQGGDIENGVVLLSHLFDQPFAVVQKYFSVDNKQLKECNGPSLGLHKPHPNAFKGNLYVLMNGGSFSNSGIAASCLKAYHRATFIGEETGGNPNVIAGFIKDIELPNTKIRVQIPTKQFLITTQTNNRRGLLPDYEVLPQLTDILAGKDTALQFAIDQILATNKSK